MGSGFFGEKFGAYKQFVLPVGLALIGLVFLGYGLIVYFQPKKDSPDISFEGASISSGAVKTAVSPVLQDQMMVDVEGAVEKPGVYRLSQGSRIQDALIAAGGMSENADRTVTSKSLNMAMKLNDGAKVYIPVKGETVESSVQNLGTQGVSGGLVDINSASLSDLDALPGIGASTAQKIVSNRPYATIEDLMSKKVVGEKEFEKIKDKVTVN